MAYKVEFALPHRCKKIRKKIKLKIVSEQLLPPKDHLSFGGSFLYGGFVFFRLFVKMKGYHKMNGDQVSAAFRTLIEKCLKQAMTQNGAGSESDFSHDSVLQYQNLAKEEPEIRTETNLRVIRDFLRN